MVGVPVDRVDQVIAAMDGALIRGKPAGVRRFTPNRDRGNDRERGERNWTPRRDAGQKRQGGPRRDRAEGAGPPRADRRQNKR